MKDKNTKYWLLGAGAFLWWLAGRTANAALNLKFKPSGFRFVMVDEKRDSATVAIKVAFMNPTRHDILVRDIAAQLYFNGTFIADVNQRVNRHIRGGQISELEFLVNIKYTEVVRELYRQFQTMSIDNWAVNARGSLSVDNLYLPLNLTFYAEDFLY